MPIPPGIRKLALTAHVTSSVGWLGAVASFLVLALIGYRAADDSTVRSLYVAMERMGWFVIVPFSIAALMTGLLQSAITSWGFFRHYWVVSKLLLTVGASGLLLLHMQVMSTVAEAASTGALTADHLREPRMQLLADAASATVILLLATALSVFKPEGRIFGSPKKTPMFYAFWGGLAALFVAIVIRHLSGGMPVHH